MLVYKKVQFLLKKLSDYLIFSRLYTHFINMQYFTAKLR